MLKSWHTGRRLTPETIFNYFSAKTKALDKKYYQEAIKDDGGLSFVSKEYNTNGQLVAQYYNNVEVKGFFEGLNFKPLLGVSEPKDWIPALKKYGPLIVFRLNPAHVRVLIGAWEYGKDTHDQMIVIDPATGDERRILMEHFQNEIGMFANLAGWNKAIWYAPK
jgi:hypothetical protein